MTQLVIPCRVYGKGFITTQKNNMKIYHYNSDQKMVEAAMKAVIYLQITLVILRLCHTIIWHWALVLLPILLATTFCAVMVLIFVASFVIYLIKKAAKKL